MKLKIQQLQLNNPHQHSYAHAVLLSLLWTASCIQDGLPIANPGLRKLLQWLSTPSKPQPLWQTLAWQALTKTWSHPLRHHDPASFLHYLQPLIFTAGAGEWQARSLGDASPMQSWCHKSRKADTRGRYNSLQSRTARTQPTPALFNHSCSSGTVKLRFTG